MNDLSSVQQCDVVTVFLSLLSSVYLRLESHKLDTEPLFGNTWGQLWTFAPRQILGSSLEQAGYIQLKIQQRQLSADLTIYHLSEGWAGACCALKRKIIYKKQYAWTKNQTVLDKINLFDCNFNQGNNHVRTSIVVK
jgi:hypothetical protein